jgi:hypothetical protein
MGYGEWNSSAYVTHSTVSRGFSSMDAFSSASTQELYRSRRLDSILDPKGVMRECCDSNDHPKTVPVILALDVTGSMGSAASAIATQLNEIMTQIYAKVADVQFLVMAIGDLSYDHAPIQASQFESDIRIAEQLEKVFFEGGGGGNNWESYTAAWYFGLKHTKLDCWKRGKKGIIITLGDESLNPYLPSSALGHVMGDSLQGDVYTDSLYKEALEKFDIFHLAIDDPRTSYRNYTNEIRDSWGKLLGQNLMVTKCDQLPKVIADIVSRSEESSVTSFNPFAASTPFNPFGGSESINDNLISW